MWILTKYKGEQSSMSKNSKKMLYFIFGIAGIGTILKILYEIFFSKEQPLNKNYIITQITLLLILTVVWVLIANIKKPHILLKDKDIEQNIKKIHTKGTILQNKTWFVEYTKKFEDHLPSVLWILLYIGEIPQITDYYTAYVVKWIVQKNFLVRGGKNKFAFSFGEKLQTTDPSEKKLFEIFEEFSIHEDEEDLSEETEQIITFQDFLTLDFNQENQFISWKDSFLKNGYQWLIDKNFIEPFFKDSKFKARFTQSGIDYAISCLQYITFSKNEFYFQKNKLTTEFIPSIAAAMTILYGYDNHGIENFYKINYNISISSLRKNFRDIFQSIGEIHINPSN